MTFVEFSPCTHLSVIDCSDGFQCSFKEANKNKNDHLSPWESWLLRKVCEERKRNEEAIAKKAKEEEDKKEVARLKSAKMQESQQKFYNWVSEPCGSSSLCMGILYYVRILTF